MAIKTDPDDLNQGLETAVAGAVFATGTGADIRIHTAAANNLPALAANEFFEVRDHSDGVNNGLYQVVTVTTSTDDYECDKVTGSAPITAGAEAITTLGETGVSDEKSIMFDTSTLEILLLEQGNLDADGVTGQAVYSRAMKDWKDDNYLSDTVAADFPMLTIDADAGKFVVGQDNQGNNNGWNWKDDAGFSIRTRKLMRNAGWDEIDANGVRKASHVGIGTLGGFEDAANDKARFFFGTDTSVDNSSEFDFPGPVNEAILYFNEIGNPTGCDFATSSTITRSSGSFVTDGYVVGGQVTVRNADNAAHDGSYVLTAVAALTLTVTGTPFTGPDPDANAQLAVDNQNAIKLRNRIRDADPTGKTYTQADLASGNYTALRSGFMTFPLSSVSDPNITETDANIDANTPYTGMSLTLYGTPQSLGSDLVGGPYNFGMQADANGGTKTELFEWIQRQLRKLTDIDAGAGTNIGIMLDDLATFVGATLEVGRSSPTDGSKFPVNPEGGGSGIYITGLAAISKNTTVMFDNLGTQRGYPIGTPVTADINQILIDDTSAKLAVYLDRSIRNVVADLVITAGTGANGTFDSVGSNLPASLDKGVGAYVRVAGLTGGDAAMNGTYQVTALTSQAQWNVTRRDAATIVTTSSASANIDENCFNTPDSIILNTDNNYTGTGISFTAPDTIGDTGNGLAFLSVGDFFRIEGAGANNGIYQVDTVVAGTITTIEQTIATAAAGPSITLTEVFKHDADADYSASVDYSNNAQGGRVSGDIYVRGKASGAAEDGAQRVTSGVIQLQAAVAATVPLSASLERNFTP